jgi:hypothetical protein
MPATGGAAALPPTYVFGDLRGVLLDHVLRTDLMLTGARDQFASFRGNRRRLRAAARQRATGGGLIANGGIGIVSVRGGNSCNLYFPSSLRFRATAREAGAPIARSAGDLVKWEAPRQKGKQGGDHGGHHPNSNPAELARALFQRRPHSCAPPGR